MPEPECVPKPLTEQRLEDKRACKIIACYGRSCCTDLIATVDALTAERESLKQAIRDIDRLYERDDHLQLRSLLANLRGELT